jgi:hypothetical protein
MNEHPRLRAIRINHEENHKDPYSDNSNLCNADGPSILCVLLAAIKERDDEIKRLTSSGQ